MADLSVNLRVDWSSVNMLELSSTWRRSMTTNQHGGHRPNAGRPINQSRGRLVRVLISLYPDQREWLAGQGSVAAAVRAAIDEKIQREVGR